MSASNVPASHGWNWIAQALDVLKRYPMPFLVMGLIFGVIGIIPVLGGLVLLILGPALIAGTCYAAQQAEQGKTPEIGNLFRGFQEGDRIGPLITLCIPLVVGLVVIGILFGIFAVGAAVSGGKALMTQAEGNPMVLFQAMGFMSLLIMVPLAIIIALGIYGLTFFAIPRTLLDKADAFASMKESLAACRKNFGAFLVTIVILMLGVFVLSAIFKVLHLGVVGDILVSTALYSILGSTLYFAYRDVLGGGAASTHAEVPVPPPAPPVSSEPPMPPAPPTPPAPAA